MVDDFLYICDDAYTRSEFVKMEKEILRTVDFRLGMPISYRFLRRFAKVSRYGLWILHSSMLPNGFFYSPCLRISGSVNKLY